MPLPGYWREPYELDEHGWLEPSADSFEFVEPSPRDPGETYLELAAIDADDASAIVDFVSRYGALGVRGDEYAAIRHIPWWKDVWPALRADVRTRYYGDDDPGTPLHVNELGSRLESLREFRLGVRAMRELVAAFHATQHPDDLSSRELLRAEAVLVNGFREALRPFHPTLLGGPEDPMGVSSRAYGRCCLELYNHIVENAVYRQCANETCPRRPHRFFVRHRGRTEYGRHHLTGVRYCSTDCARMQTQREYRRRKREEKKS